MRTVIFTAVLTVFLMPGITSADDVVVTTRFLSNSNLWLYWNAVHARFYRVQCKTNLADADWQDVPGQTIGCWGGASRLLLTTNQPQRFLRVVDMGTNGVVPLGYQDPTGNWLLFHQFSMQLSVQPALNDTDPIFVTRGGYALRSSRSRCYWDVIDGPPSIRPELDQAAVFSDLLNDDRVLWVYPGRTDSTFRVYNYYINALIIQLQPPFTDIAALLSEQNLTQVGYHAPDEYYAAVTRKTDDPFVIAQRLQGDPRLKYAVIVHCMEPRGYDCGQQP